MSKPSDAMKAVVIDYTNYEGKRAWRHVVPRSFKFSSAKPWHPERAWLMEAFDLQKKLGRTFAMDNIHAWHAADSAEGRMVLRVLTCKE